MKKTILFFFSISLCLLANAQEFENISPARSQIHDKDISQLSPIEILEDSLVYLADSMYFSALDENRINGSYDFIRVFKSFVKNPASFNAPLIKLKEKINIIESPDHTFRIYNWEIVRSAVERRYYGTIQTSQGDIFPLIDISDQVIRGAEDSVFINKRWFGNLYYNIVMKDVGGQKMYFLLGWNGNSMNSDRKIVDVLSFNRGQVVFGAPVFNLIDRGKRKQTKRMVLEYEKSAKVAMNLEKDSDQIIFDHCESQIGDPAKKYTFIPDGTYDGLNWDGNQWIMNENVVQITILKDGEAPLEKVNK